VCIATGVFTQAGTLARWVSGGLAVSLGTLLARARRGRLRSSALAPAGKQRMPGAARICVAHM